MWKLLQTPGMIIIVFTTLLFCVSVISFSTYLLYPDGQTYAPLPSTPLVTTDAAVARFPVGVNQVTKTITENRLVDLYMNEELSINTSDLRKNRFFDRLLAKLVQLDFYQQIASPITRVLVIYPGQRKEEVTSNFAKILDWDATEQTTFLTLITKITPELTEGKFYPGHYTVPRLSSPEIVTELIRSEFYKDVVARYDSTVDEQVSFADALTIASLLEREAYDFTDMRIISGIIWNRLFIDMPLQLDASLQYVRGSSPSEADWWPKVVPDDKFLDSPFNTYQEVGLPPAPIANPSLEAIVAALNPRVTDCLFYFHDTDGTFYCSETYEGHVAKLKALYGTGK